MNTAHFLKFFIVLTVAILVLNAASLSAQAGEHHDHDHSHAENPLVLDASFFGKSAGLDFHHTHFKQDKSFQKAGASFREFCRDRVDGTVPNDRDYGPLFSRLKAAVGYFESQGYKDIKVNVVSCFRSAKTNGIVRASSLQRNGGRTGVAKRSQHTYGTAIDFYLTSQGKMISIPQTTNVMCAMARQGGGGVGKYAGWVHADTRSNLAQWGGANCSSKAVNALLVKSGGVQG